MNVQKGIFQFQSHNVCRGMVTAVAVLFVLTGCIHQPEREIVGDPPVLEGVIHTVSPGENLVGIARAYGLTPQRLERINNLHDPNHLDVGKRLFIPGADTVKTGTMVRAAAPREKGVYHEVQRGETLWRIAQAYQVDRRTLEQYNRIHEPRSLEVGRRIFIPGVDEVKAIEMSVAERVYHKTPELPREKRVELAKKIEKIVERHKAEKEGVAPPEPQPESDSKAKTTSTSSSEVKEPPQESISTAPVESVEEEPERKIPPADVKPPEKVKNVGQIAFSWPLAADFTVAKQFGVGTGLMSNGMILAAPSGTPVIAAADGEVKLVGDVNDEFGDTLGNYVILYHGKRGGKGVRTIYGHNSEVLVTPGQKVKRGQVIAYVGRSGRVAKDVSRNQLHFQIREEVQAMNPMKLLPSLR